MTHEQAPAARAAIGRLTTLRDLLALLAALRELREPVTSPAGLRQSIALLLRLAELIGIEPAWIERLRRILEDPGAFNIVLAVVQYALGLASRDSSSGGVVRLAGCDGDEGVEVTAEALAEWLPPVIQIVGLLRQIRGEA